MINLIPRPCDRAMAVFLLCVAGIPAQDWPSYRGNNARSGVSKTNLALPLRQAWVHRAKGSPQPAWPGPAKADLYNKLSVLQPRLAFDRAFHVSIGKGKLWFGSSADDQVHCLDARTGEELWTFFAEAPIRFAPTYSGGRVFFGSDDGRAYCLRASNGEEVWRHTAAPQDMRVPGNGRVMSVWPVRTGVVVHDGKAYFCAGLFPAEASYLCALRVASGIPVWKKSFSSIQPQGYMLASADHLYVPTGRGPPIVFSRKTGDKIRQLGGEGGTFALLAGDSLIYGPGKAGSIGEFAGTGQDHVATFQGNQMVVTRDMAWLLTTRELSALRRTRYLELLGEKNGLAAQTKERNAELKKQKGNRVKAAQIQRKIEEIGERLSEISQELRACFVWRRACALSLELIVVGDHLVTGGDGEIAVFDASSGKEVWRATVEGRAYGLAAADGRLYVSTDLGRIHCFAAQEER
ncbi:MAG: PQQ-binding-like beta-propeller repeat protein [Planctomycetota bacterium]|jgi:hypothetical protein|nr:PQQ-binding-like beta-propeller repeat protein [Planctomycetota bacterium]